MFIAGPIICSNPAHTNPGINQATLVNPKLLSLGTSFFMTLIINATKDEYAINE
jgi:hypothetical protein